MFFLKKTNLDQILDWQITKSTRQTKSSLITFLKTIIANNEVKYMSPLY
jgi:hypothetical protein